MKPISKGKLLANLYANSTVYRKSAAYLFNTVAKDENPTVSRHARRVANIFQKRSIAFYERAKQLEIKMKDVDVNAVVNEAI